MSGVVLRCSRCSSKLLLYTRISLKKKKKKRKRKKEKNKKKRESTLTNKVQKFGSLVSPKGITKIS